MQPLRPIQCVCLPLPLAVRSWYADRVQRECFMTRPNRAGHNLLAWPRGCWIRIWIWTLAGCRGLPSAVLSCPPPFAQKLLSPLSTRLRIIFSILFLYFYFLFFFSILAVLFLELCLLHWHHLPAGHNFWWAFVCFSGTQKPKEVLLRWECYWPTWPRVR